ncbi:hypothetical protein EDD25_1795 [Cryobacterium psychrophilum]|nr:hypothetical protein EDD25_1795 [Cryobacterium psychrophilum]
MIGAVGSSDTVAFPGNLPSESVCQGHVQCASGEHGVSYFVAVVDLDVEAVLGGAG